jgi:uncharacterized protein (TIGR03435 family)
VPCGMKLRAFEAGEATVVLVPRLIRTARLSVFLCALTAGLSAQEGTVATQASTTAVPVFDVVSVKPCAPLRGAAISREFLNSKPSSPGHLAVRCRTLVSLVETSLESIAGAAGGSRGLPVAIEGGPSWVRSDTFEIQAKADGAPDKQTMNGPMLWSILEKRFGLKVRRETRMTPAYALVKAKGGPKMKPYEGDACMVPGRIGDPLIDRLPVCKVTRKMTGKNIAMDMVGYSIDDLIETVLGVDRPVINETGLTGRFNMYLEFAVDESTPGWRRPAGAVRPGDVAAEADPPAASIFTAVRDQLGLRLEPVKRPREFTIIESVERPSEN